MPAITQDDLLQALADAMTSAGPDDAKTFAELEDAHGIGSSRLRKLLRRLHQQGRLEVINVKRPSLSGVLQPIPAYRIKK